LGRDASKLGLEDDDKDLYVNEQLIQYKKQELVRMAVRDVQRRGAELN